MTNSERRTWLKKQYPNDTWARKVDKMSDRQVYAIWQSIDRKQKAAAKAEAENHQLTLDEWVQNKEENANEQTGNSGQSND